MSPNNATPTSAPLYLQTRTPLIDLPPLPLYGKTVSLFLLREDTVICAPHASGHPSGKTLSELFNIDGTDLHTFKQLCASNEQDGACIALLCPTKNRVLLLFRMQGIPGGALLGLLPDIAASSVARTLNYSFSDRVTVIGALQNMGTPPLRQADQKTYAHLAELLRHQIALPQLMRTWVITDRRTFHHHLQRILDMVLTMLDLPLPAPAQMEFPLPLPFEGTLHASQAFWMCMCLFGGMLHSFPTAKEGFTLRLDDEHLLPTLIFAAGNRSKLPSEWQECHDMAARCGLFFDVHRAKDRIFVRFCPMVPHAEDADEFYRLCAPCPSFGGDT